MSTVPNVLVPFTCVFRLFAICRRQKMCCLRPGWGADRRVVGGLYDEQAPQVRQRQAKDEVPSLSELAVTRVASMSMTSHPVRVLPAMASHGNPAGVASMSFHACSLAFARARRSGPAWPGRRPGRGRGGPWDRWGRRRARARGGRAGRCRSCWWPRARSPPPATRARSPVQQRRRALLPQRAAQGGGESRLVGGLAEQDGAGVADDQPGSCRGDLQGMVPPVILLHGGERSSSGD
jgi:hypothetical protein